MTGYGEMSITGGVVKGLVCLGSSPEPRDVHLTVIETFVFERSESLLECLNGEISAVSM